MECILPPCDPIGQSVLRLLDGGTNPLGWYRFCPVSQFLMLVCQQFVLGCDFFSSENLSTC